MTKHSVRIFGVNPLFKLQNNRQTVKHLFVLFAAIKS